MVVSLNPHGISPPLCTPPRNDRANHTLNSAISSGGDADQLGPSEAEAHAINAIDRTTETEATGLRVEATPPSNFIKFIPRSRCIKAAAADRRERAEYDGMGWHIEEESSSK